jgi:hypothetical protein
MSPTEQVGKVATGTVDALKSQPLALALVVVNVLFLVGGSYVASSFMKELGNASLRKDELLADMAKRCLYATPPARGSIDDR